MAKGQPRLPKGTPTKGRVHAGEFTTVATATARPKPPGRRDKGARGRSGTQLPKSAPIHDRKTTAPQPKASGRHDPGGGKMPEEMVGGFKCKACGYPGWREHKVVTKEGAEHATLAFAGCTNCGTLHVGHVGMADRAIKRNESLKRRIGKTLDEDLDLLKTIDSSETALGAQDLDGGTTDLVGHRNECPRGGSSPCGKERGGRCTLCDVRVQDHQALGKTQVTVLELRKLAGLD